MNSKPPTISVNSDEAHSFKLSLSKLQTPSVLERVVDWIELNEKNSSIFENRSGANNSDAFFRCDYKSSRTSEYENINYNSASIFNKSVPLCEPIDTEFTYVRRPRRVNTVDSKAVKKFSNESVHKIATSSVENKKGELCSYLKLMTCDVKKQIFRPGNRRSTRVQNSDKKKEIFKTSEIWNDEICSEKSVKTTKSRISNRLKVFPLECNDDFNINIVDNTSKYPLLQEDLNKRIFNFIMPPNSVLQEFYDFQHWMEHFISDNNLVNDKPNLQQIKNTFDSTELKRNQFNKEKFEVKASQMKGIIKRKTEIKRFRKIKLRDISSVIFPERIEIRNNDEIETKCDINKTERNSYLKKLSPNHNRNEFTIVIHNDEVIRNSVPDQNSPNSPNIEKVDENNPEKQNIKIRVDYEVQSNKNKKELQSDDIQMPCFLGFSKNYIDESKEIVTKLCFYMRSITSVPDKNETEVQFDRSKLKNNGFCRKSSITRNCLINSNIEGIESECSVTSDSVESSELSNNSSSSHSSSMYGNINLKKQSIPSGERINLCDILQRVTPDNPLIEKKKLKPLHDLLIKQSQKVPSSVSSHYLQDWDSDNSLNDKRKFGTNESSSHSILFSKENGSILNAVYDNFHLILVQEFAVSIWNQTSLGNVLGSQNLWIFYGDTKKLILNRECIRKKTLEMTISTENCVAYVELWTKEHKSDIRQGPVADIFAIVYFWLQKLNRMDKKVHQLENINGFSDDVQYVVLKSSLKIAMSWHSVINDVKITQVHIYTLAGDFQTIVNVRSLSKVEHYVSSLHNIEDCAEVLMGCGEHTITLWNIEHGYIVATIKLNDIKLSLSALWTKCDRGILFIVQQCVDKELRLIAINGRNHSWKKLKSFKPSEGFERLQSVYIENGVLICFYEEGLLCWKALTEEQILEETHETDVTYFPSGKYVVMTTERSVFVKHVLTHLITSD